MTIKYAGTKMTPRQVAKHLVYDALTTAMEIDKGAATVERNDKEEQEIVIEISKFTADFKKRLGHLKPIETINDPDDPII